ncbi:hypothetical protein Cni_G05177 [Canna indica]|uniref:VQ domain-containing protein n=1 Tax=Canna indica TaxID=4628 RepID=A0AAQ3JYL0_9LILI|nr:hypothetical protein Cni_G05177 [Canna indica]
MDNSYESDLAMGPRRELHGPRPTPLKVRKDSHKIKKPPVAPPPPQQPQPQPPHQIRRPVIIYTVSPKVIHTTPGDFMSVVQRLTGSAAAGVPPSTSHASQAFSPAARLAALEKAAKPAAAKSERDLSDYGMLGAVLETFPGGGILSPVPSSLPRISPSLFAPSTATEQNQINLLNELSPGFHGNYKSLLGMSSFLLSPNNLLSCGIAPSPAAAAYWDLFNNYQVDSSS